MNSVLGMIIAFDTDNDLREITEHRTDEYEHPL